MKGSVSSKMINTIGLALLLLVLAEPAFAGISVGQTLLDDIKGWLTLIGSTIITIALMVVGFRMAFQAAEWKDVAPIFWGGVLIGGAATLGPLFVK